MYAGQKGHPSRIPDYPTDIHEHGLNSLKAIEIKPDTSGDAVVVCGILILMNPVEIVYYILEMVAIK
jgi:hypothetical protein